VDLLGSGFDLEILRKIFGDAAASDFARTLAIFCAAAYVHGRKVSKAIKDECEKLIHVVQTDLEAQRNLLGKLDYRVQSLEQLNKHKGE